MVVLATLHLPQRMLLVTNCEHCKYSSCMGTRRQCAPVLGWGIVQNTSIWWLRFVVYTPAVRLTRYVSQCPLRLMLSARIRPRDSNFLPGVLARDHILPLLAHTVHHDATSGTNACTVLVCCQCVPATVLTLDRIIASVLIGAAIIPLREK